MAESRVEEQPWYYGILSGDDLHAYLTTPGEFLVRCWDFGKGMELIISYKTDRGSTASGVSGSDKQGGETDTICHTLLRFNGTCGGWHVKRETRPFFDTVEALVEYYGTHDLPTGGRLLRGSTRPNWLLRHSQIKYNHATDLLGSGNFCDVYKGLFNDREDVAVKVCHQSEGKDKATLEAIKAMESLIEEGRLMSQINHVSIIRFIGLCCESVPVMIAMELCVRPLLGHLVKLGDSISDGERIRYMVDVADGMAYLHSKNLIHRDLAARNCLFSKTGVCKVADFGLSKLVRDLVAESHGNAQMPIRWMAPETLLASPHFSTKSDVWAFSVLLFEVFTNGNKPFDGDEWVPKRIATHIRKGNMVDPPAKAPTPVQQLMKSCWKVHPEDRLTFPQILATLQDIQKRVPAPDPGDSTLASVPGILILTAEELALIKPSRANIATCIEQKYRVHGRKVPQPPSSPANRRPVTPPRPGNRSATRRLQVTQRDAVEKPEGSSSESTRKKPPPPPHQNNRRASNRIKTNPRKGSVRNTRRS